MAYIGSWKIPDLTPEKQTKIPQRRKAADAKIDQLVLDALDGVPAIRKGIMTNYQVVEGSMSFEGWVRRSVESIVDQIGEACAESK